MSTLPPSRQPKKKADELKAQQLVNDDTARKKPLLEKYKAGQLLMQEADAAYFALDGQHIHEVGWSEPKSDGGLPPIVPMHVFLKEPLPEPPQIIRGVLHQGCKLTLGGGSKTFKSWSLIDLALSVAYGLPWLGIPTTLSKVCYLNFELPEFSFQKRLFDILKAKGSSKTNGDLRMWHLRGYSQGYAELVPKLTAELQGKGFGLVVLDPVYKLYGPKTDENSAKDVAALCMEVERLTKDIGASIAIAHHFSKGNQATKESIDRFSGSGVFARDADALLTFTPHDDKDSTSFSVEATLRNFEAIKPFVVTWRCPLFERNGNLNPTHLKGRTGAPQKHKPEDILALLTPEGISPKALLELAKKRGMSKQTVYTIIGQLEEQKKATKKDSKWCLVQ